MDSKEYQKLIEHVEPFSWKEKFTMPKFIINAASDEFFVTDSWQFYWDQLPGEKHLRYVPNAGHSLEGTYQMENLASFYYRFLNNIDQPSWSWNISNDTIFVNVDQGQSYKLMKWEANNPKERDFRIYEIGKIWQKTDLEISDSGYYAIPISSDEGYTAALVEVVFDPEGDMPLILSTGTVVTPSKYPFEKYVPEKILGTR
jgi:PhoPQ-activated pathogenicity-related protein